MAICAHNFFIEIKSHALCQILPKERQFRHAYSGTICPCKEARKHMSSLEWSPLHIAAEQGSLEGCNYIIEKTGDYAPLSNIDKLTPLHLAAFNGHLGVCNLLLDSMRDKNPSDKNGRTPLHLAALQVLISIVLLLVLYQMGIPAYYFKEKIAIPPIYCYVINQRFHPIHLLL